MSLFRMYWLRRYFRRHTNPIPVDRAELWKRRLSIGYAIMAWQAFGLVMYMIFTGKADWAKHYGLDVAQKQETPAYQWTKTLGIKDATVYRVSGFNVSKYEIHHGDEDENKTNPTEETAS